MAGNRTRASRVAGENSTTEPPVLLKISSFRMDSCTMWRNIIQNQQSSSELRSIPDKQRLQVEAKFQILIHLLYF